MDLLLYSLIAAGLGIASHLAYFIRGEHHLHSVQLALLLFIFPLLLWTSIVNLVVDIGTQNSLRLSATLTATYLLSLTASILIYRIFFHRLRHFPGPFGAKISKLSHVLRLLGKSDNYIQTDRLHKHYGEIVR
jgi:hypothetical protein